MPFIPVNEPDLSGNEKKYLLECIRTGWISSEGPFVKKFEQAFSQKVSRKYGIAVINGTAALDIAITALGIKKGDEVIMPTFTIISCALAVVRAGAIPVYVDADPMTWNMKVDDLEKNISKKTKAIMIVHIYGLPVDMDKVLRIAKKHGLKVIEDASQMHGATYKGKPCGSFGDVSTFSFYSNKLVTTGEGGMVVTNDPDIAERSVYYRNVCFDRERRYIHEDLGWNYRMTNLQAAVGLAQLERLTEFVKRKHVMGEIYSNNLFKETCIQIPIQETPYAKNIYWAYGVVLTDRVALDAEKMITLLKERGIGSRHFFYPMHLQPALIKHGVLAKGKYPISEMLSQRGLYLPCSITLTKKQIEFICKEVRSILKAYKV